MIFKLLETRLHGVLDKTMHHNIQYWSWERLAVIWGSCMTDRFSQLPMGTVPGKGLWKKNTSIGYFCWETPIMCIGVTQERNCLLNIVSWKQISYDFCTSFVLHKVKKAFGGSRWNFMMLVIVTYLHLLPYKKILL